MKDLKTMEKKQYDLKASLHELVEFMNSKEFFAMNETRKKMYTNLKVAIEMHLKCLSILVHENLDSPIVNIPDFSWIGIMMGMFTPPSFNTPKTELKEADFENHE